MIDTYLAEVFISLFLSYSSFLFVWIMFCIGFYMLIHSLSPRHYDKY